MKQVIDCINESTRNDQMNESVALTIGAAALAIGALFGGTQIANAMSVKREERKTKKLAMKMQRMNMLRDANRQDWNDFFDVVSRFNPDTMDAIIRSEPDLKDAFDSIDKDKEIERLRQEVSDLRNGGQEEESLFTRLAEKIKDKLDPRNISLLNKAASNLGM